MDVSSMCRICLVQDVTMYCLVNTKLQDIYEKLTATSFQSEDSRPLRVCYMCYGRLQSCHRLHLNCIKSEQLLTEILKHNQLKPKQSVDMSTLKIVHPLVQLSCVPVSVEVTHDDEADHPVEPVDVIHVHVKEENIEDEEENITDEEFNVDCTEAGVIVKIENINEDVGESNYKTHIITTSTSNYNDNIQDTKPYINVVLNVQHDITPNANINCTELSNNMQVKPIEIVSKDMNLKNNEANAPAVQNHELNKKAKKSKTTATFANHKKSKTKMATEAKPNEEKVNAPVVKTDGSPYKCDICGKCFIRTQHLEQHIRVHTGERPYKCDMCKKCFNQKQHLTQHIRLHTGEKPFKCDICEKRFNLKHNLKQHSRLHTGEKPFQCDMCERSFNQKHHLIQHKNIHTGERPYRCDICDKRFMRRQDLFLHNRTHTGDKPYRCDLCEKSFYQKHHLVLHSRHHTGEKPYKCHMCEKSFNRNQNLKSHLRTHSGDRSCRCDMCGECFNERSTLLRHMHFKHRS